MRSQGRWMTAAVAAAVAALAIGQASAQSYSNSNNNGYANGHARTVRCESTNSRRVFCRVNTHGGVRIVRQLSHSSCRQGRTWNYDSRGIWVNSGCRADFAINSGRNDRRGDSYSANRDDSDDSRYSNDRDDPYDDRNSAYSDRNNEYQNTGYDDSNDDDNNSGDDYQR